MSNITTLTVELQNSSLEGPEKPFVAKVQHWPNEGETRQPTEWGLGRTEREAISNGISDMLDRLDIDADGPCAPGCEACEEEDHPPVDLTGVRGVPLSESITREVPGSDADIERRGEWEADARD